MPGGLAFDSTQSYVAFAVVKLIGYSAFAYYLKRVEYPGSNTPFWIVGLARTIIGMLFGALIWLIGGRAGFDIAFDLFLVLLLPARVIEWLLLLLAFFYRKDNDKPRLVKNVALGIVWSFVLDIPAIFGFIVTGGFWIC